VSAEEVQLFSASLAAAGQALDQDLPGAG
jgi:hypothetical protein